MEMGSRRERRGIGIFLLLGELCWISLIARRRGVYDASRWVCIFIMLLRILSARFSLSSLSKAIVIQFRR